MKVMAVIGAAMLTPKRIVDALGLSADLGKD